MKKFLLLFLLISSSVMAAEQITIRDINNGTFAEERIAAARPLSDGESYAQISSDGKQIVKCSFKTGKQTGVLFDANNVRGAKIDRVEGYIMSPDGKRMLIQTNTKPIYRRSFTATYYIYLIENNKVEPLSDGGPQQVPIFSPDGNQIAFVRDNNIYLVKLLYDNAESQVTKDGEFNKIINGIPDWVNEEEFEFNTAMTFNADGTMICWLKYDESRVKQYSLQTFCGMEPANEEYAVYPGNYTYKYPKAGEDNSKVSAWSYDIKSHQTRQLDIPLDADGYMPRIFTTNDPAKVVVYTMNRHQDNLSIYTVNPRSTVSQLLMKEQVDKYVTNEVMESIQFTDKHIVMLSDRDNYKKIYVYSPVGSLQRTIDMGQHDVIHLYGIDDASGDVYFQAAGVNPMNREVYVGHQNGKVEKLTQKEGINSAIFSSNYKYFIHNWSDINTPPTIELCTNQGKTIATMVDNKNLRQKLSSYSLSSKEFFKFTTSEGVELNGWMIKPAGFSASRQYPVVMFQYSGPGNQQVLNSWSSGAVARGAMFCELMAQQGYVVVCVDGRGTGGRGADFEKCTYLKLGQLEARDQVETALWLGKQSFVDKNRIGIWGWSYGGYCTLMSMSEGRGVFACGVAIAPPTSYRWYDTIYTERYMRTPKENPQGYNDNALTRASKLNGQLLICHGIADDNVHIQNSIEYSEALVQADKDFRQLFYNNRNHSIYGGNTRNHLFRQVLNFFDDNLKK